MTDQVRPISSCSNGTSRSCGSPTPSCSSRWPRAPTSSDASSSQGPTLREAVVAIPDGSLDLERLAAAGDPPPGQAQFLRFVPKPFDALELARWRNRPDRQRFSAPGRLARVGLAARLVDAGLVMSLLLRGRVPGGTAAAAAVALRRDPREDPRVVYHGRVIREGRWVVLHYMFLYAMNDWRSTFEGANDHEADWEQCFVVLEDLDDGELRPAWFCAAPTTRRATTCAAAGTTHGSRSREGHPVVYPGAGSHATYLEPGEYIMRLPFPGERNIRGPLDLVRRFWRDTLDQPDPGDLAENARRALSVPFVDYARGDGDRRSARAATSAGRRIIIGDVGRLGRSLPRPVGPRHR